MPKTQTSSWDTLAPKPTGTLAAQGGRVIRFDYGDGEVDIPIIGCVTNAASMTSPPDDGRPPNGRPPKKKKHTQSYHRNEHITRRLRMHAHALRDGELPFGHRASALVRGALSLFTLPARWLWEATPLIGAEARRDWGLSRRVRQIGPDEGSAPSSHGNKPSSRS